MKKFLTFFIMTVLTANVMGGCADQAIAPEPADSAAKDVAEITEDKNENKEVSEAETPADGENSPETNLMEDETDVAGEAAAEETDAPEPAALDGQPVEITSQEAEAFNQLSAPAAGDKIAVIETDMGTIKLKLFTDLAPEISKNFEELAAADLYDGVPFHRVVKDFMIQTGDFTEQNGTGGYSYKGPGTMLADEITPSLKHLYGTVSMANRGPNTNGSQFFIVTNEDGTAFLDGGYSIFGQVYEGMDVALKIANLQMTGTEKPARTVNMTNVEVMTL